MEELRLDYYFEDIENFRFKKIFDGCTYPWEVLSKTKTYIKEFMDNEDIKVNKAKVGEFCSIEGNYFIDEGTIIHSNVCIQGPVLIGKNVEIQSGALIRPGTIIGDNAVVGHGSEVKNAILQNKAKVASLAFVGDTILGKSARIGSGVILANRRFDQKNITVKINGEKIDVGTDFFGSIIGDSSRLGANAVALPGTFIGSYTWILPGVQARGFIEKEKRVFPKTEYIITENPKVELK
ncbi:MAG: glucose-1-phosphate thymidylyltransferase [Clostridia bacterium]|nr:glucose-1-phosphate thymidylyltransferase [Clostridia bacterium]